MRAIRDSDVRYAVFVSSVGADLSGGTGPVAGLHAQEHRLRRLESTNVLILRAGALFENFFEMLGLIKHQGINGGAVAPDIPIPMIATRDIAGVAAKALTARDWKRCSRARAAWSARHLVPGSHKIVGQRIGKPDLPYVQLPYADLIGALVQVGFSENAAGLYAALDRAINEGRVKPREGRSPENTTPLASKTSRASSPTPTRWRKRDARTCLQDRPGRDASGARSSNEWSCPGDCRFALLPDSRVGVGLRADGRSPLRVFILCHGGAHPPLAGAGNSRHAIH